MLGQNFVVDATLTADLKKAGQTDNLDDTVNYAAVYNDIKSIVQGKPRQLLETVAENITSTVLDKYKRVQAVTVSIKKPHVAVGGQLDSLGIEITRLRT